MRLFSAACLTAVLAALVLASQAPAAPSIHFVSATESGQGVYTVRVAGEAEGSESVYLYAESGSKCVSSPVGSGEFFATSAVSGPFTDEATWMPAFGNDTVMLCAYLGGFSRGNSANAMVGESFSVGMSSSEYAVKRMKEEEEEARSRTSIAIATLSAQEFTAAKQQEEAQKEAQAAAARAAQEQQALEEQYASCMRAVATGETEIIEERDPRESHCTETQFEQAKRELEAAEAATISAAHARPLTRLSVRAEARKGKSSRSPGETELSIKTTPYAFITVTLHRRGHRVEKWEANSHGASGDPLSWSCKSPGGVYHWTVEAKSGVGPTLKTSGAFRPVSAGRCAALKAAEATARAHSERRVEAQLARERRQEAERMSRFERNCRLENGTPRAFEVEGSARMRCVARGGGFLDVSE